jgi:hypothetical protein
MRQVCVGLQEGNHSVYPAKKRHYIILYPYDIPDLFPISHIPIKKNTIKYH